MSTPEARYQSFAFSMPDWSSEIIVATSGAVGQVIGTTVTFPLDVVKTRMQVHGAKQGTWGSLKTLIEEEGWAGVFGMLPAKAGQQGVCRFIYYFLYEFLLNMYKRVMGVDKIGTIGNLFVGYAAGVINTCTTPLEAISNIVLTSPEPISITDAAKSIVSVSGCGGLYAGWESTFFTSCNPAIQNTTYDQIKAALLAVQTPVLSASGKQRIQSLGSFSAFLVGALSKALATCATYPPSRAKSIMQCRSQLKAKRTEIDSVTGSQGAEGAPGGAPGEATEEKQPGTVGVMRHMFAEGGAAGLFTGLLPTLLKGVIQSAFMLMVKEKVDFWTRLTLMKMLKR
jgi:hypothetical protein